MCRGPVGDGANLTLVFLSIVLFIVSGLQPENCTLYKRGWQNSALRPASGIVLKL